MALVALLVGILCITYVLVKLFTNQDPDMNEDQEAERNKGKAKHQGWQFLDWQM